MSDKTVKEQVDLLRKHNDWRRGGEGDMAHPRELGEAIESVCDAALSALELRAAEQTLSETVKIANERQDRLEANQIQPGDVIFRPTDETRPPKRGEWYGSAGVKEIYQADEAFAERDIRHIYTRIDAPAPINLPLDKEASELLERVLEHEAEQPQAEQTRETIDAKTYVVHATQALLPAEPPKNLNGQSPVHAERDRLLEEIQRRNREDVLKAASEASLRAERDKLAAEVERNINRIDGENKFLVAMRESLGLLPKLNDDFVAMRARVLGEVRKLKAPPAPVSADVAERLVPVFAKRVDGKPMTAEQATELSNYLTEERAKNRTTPFTILLRRLRKESGAGLRGFAEMIDMLPSVYCQLEQGRVEPNEAQVEMIAAGLQTSLLHAAWERIDCKPRPTPAPAAETGEQADYKHHIEFIPDAPNVAQFARDYRVTGVERTTDDTFCWMVYGVYGGRGMRTENPSRAIEMYAELFDEVAHRDKQFPYHKPPKNSLHSENQRLKAEVEQAKRDASDFDEEVNSAAAELCEAVFDCSEWSDWMPVERIEKATAAIVARKRSPVSWEEEFDKRFFMDLDGHMRMRDGMDGIFARNINANLDNVKSFIRSILSNYGAGGEKENESEVSDGSQLEVVPVEVRSQSADSPTARPAVGAEMGPAGARLDSGTVQGRRVEAVERETLESIRQKLERIVCTVGCDRGVVLLSNDGPTHTEIVNGKKLQVYDHENFSPLGDALIELHDLISKACAGTSPAIANQIESKIRELAKFHRRRNSRNPHPDGPLPELLDFVLKADYQHVLRHLQRLVKDCGIEVTEGGHNPDNAFDIVYSVQNAFKSLRQQLADAQKDREAGDAIRAVEKHNMLFDRGIGAVGKPVWAARATVNDVITVGPWKRFVVDAVLSLAQQLESEGA